MLNRLRTEAWTEANFCRLRIRRKRSIARSRRRNGNRGIRRDRPLCLHLVDDRPARDRVLRIRDLGTGHGGVGDRGIGEEGDLDERRRDDRRDDQPQNRKDPLAGNSHADTHIRFEPADSTLGAGPH